MHSIESTEPCEALRGYVRAYAQRKAHYEEAATVRVPARLEPVLEFQFQDRFEVRFDDAPTVTTPRIGVIGPQTLCRATVAYRGKITSFAVFFRPAGFSQLFEIPHRELVNLGPDATEILGAQIRSIGDCLSDCNSFEQRVAVVERFLIEKALRARAVDRILISTNRLLALAGRVRIADFARNEGLGLRHFQRRFVQEIGITPKQFARICRFQSALDIKVANPQISWFEISLELGYFDQMHMIHDFKKLGGGSPERVLLCMGDMRPGALASSGDRSEGQVI